MARQAREKSSTGIYHIMLRGVNRQTIFKDDEDRQKLFETFNKFKDISNFQIYGYCFMGNHIHALLKEDSEPLSICVKRISSSFVYWYNLKYDRRGHLFQERYKSETVEDDTYFLTVLRYIHQNPVKAEIAKNVSDYKWSSYQEYVSKPIITDTKFALKLFSNDKEKAISYFKKFNNHQNEDKCLDYDEREQLTDDEIRALLLQQGIDNNTHFLTLNKETRNKILKNLKLVEGVTIRQLSRVTGISKSVIDRL